MGRIAAVTTIALVLALVGAGGAAAMGSPRVAAVQVALATRGLYGGTVDGIMGPRTRRAVVRFQRRHRLVVDGIPGPHTRRALGRLGRPRLGRRLLHPRRVGFDVSELQFLLAWHGFPSGTFDGVFGAHTEAAVREFQRHAHLGVDGVVGPATIRALHRRLPRSPIRLRRPVRAPVGDGFGPRGRRFHAGLDLTAGYGTRVRAARRGRVVVSGWDSGGYGKLVEIYHGHRVTTWYAHLSRISVRRGRHVRAGTVIGRVGSTGNATGPHLHFQVTVRGAAVNPLTALR